MIRRESGQLSESGRRDLSALLPLLNRFTLLEFKGPTDAMESGDLAQLIGCAFLWQSQQIQQFLSLGEVFAMQHADSQYMPELEDELATSVLEAIPPERRLRGLSPEERVRGLSPEELLRALPLEELVEGMSEEQAAHVRELLERKRSR